MNRPVAHPFAFNFRTRGAGRPAGGRPTRRSGARHRAVRHIHLFACAAAIITCMFSYACIFPSHAYSPPALVAPMGSLGPVNTGVVRVDASVHTRAETGSILADDSDAYVQGAFAHVRTGLTNGIEVNLGARAGWLDSQSRVSPGTNQVAFRTGARLSTPEARNYFSADLGLGGGTHEGGAFISPDVALSIGYAGRFGSAWLRGESFVSVPVNAQDQQVIVDSEDVEFADPVAVWGGQSPRVSGGYLIRPAFTLNLVETGRVRPSLLFSFAVGEVRDRDESANVTEFSAGLSFAIHRPEPGDMPPVTPDSTEAPTASDE